MGSSSSGLADDRQIAWPNNVESMKPKDVSLLILVLAFAAVRLGVPLKSEILFKTGEFSCTSQKDWRVLKWKNHAGILLVRKLQVWGGMNEGAIADLGFFVVRDRAKVNLALGNQDHYRDGEYVQMYDFAPDFILLLPGDTLTLGYHCQVWGDHQGTGNVIITMWYLGF
jgi:hypothetical protein